MAMLRGRRCRGFTLVELLVVIAVIGVLIALLVPAVQGARESSNRSVCQNNLRQIALAAAQFHDHNGHLPAYFAYSEPKSRKGPTSTPRINGQIYGGWLPHLLPYLEQQAVYDIMTADIAAAGRGTNETVTLTAASGGTSTTTPVYVNINGISYETDTTTTTGGTSATTQTTYHGIWIPNVSNAYYPWARCPSDTSAAPKHLVGANNIGFKGWALTNYLANWNAWSDSSGNGTATFGDWSYKKYGFYSGPVKFRQIEDGTSNVVLLGEAYALCDGLGRYAMYTANQHNFGITPGLGKSFTVTSSSGGTFPPGSYAPMSNGYPNTFLFQRRPLAKTYAQCKPGEVCCNRWLAQTPHHVMHVALVDGSVRSVDLSVGQENWTRALLPRDGASLGAEW